MVPSKSLESEHLWTLPFRCHVQPVNGPVDFATSPLQPRQLERTEGLLYDHFLRKLLKYTMPNLGKWFGRFKKHKSQVNTPPPRPTPSSNLSTTVGNGLTVGLGLLEKAVTGIGVPGLEAVVNGVVGVIDLIKDVRDNADDLRDLDDLMSSLANAISMAPNIHPGVEVVPELLLSRLNTFLSELHGMLMEVKEMLGEKNAVVRTANSRAHKDAVEGIKERINRLLTRFSAEGILSLELDMAGARRDIRSVSEAIAVTQDHIAVTRKDIAGTQEHLVVTQTAQDYESLINAIPRVHARYNDTSTKPTRPCHPGTRTGLLHIIKKWIEDDPDATLYFWLCGEVGVGKSTVAHTIAQEQEELGRLGASFFFSRHDESRRTPHLLFTSIAYQLARFDQGFYNALAKALKPDPDIVKRSPTEQFKRLVLQPLSQSDIGALRTVVIVVDGLDECSDPASILDVLTLGVDDVGVRLRVLISSRPYAAILSKFKDPRLFHLTSESQFHDINPETLSSDVAVYLSWSLGAIALKSNIPSPWPPKEQLDELILRAAGLFIIASTYAKYIDDPEVGNPTAQMARILSRRKGMGSSPLAELDALYDQVLDDLKSKLPSEVTTARDIISTVMLAPEAISVLELAGLWGIDPFDVRLVLRRLTAVILLPDDDTGSVTPFHASFGEYIRDPSRCTVRELSVDTDGAYGRIVARCFATIRCLTKNGILGVEFDAASGQTWIPMHLHHISQFLYSYLSHCPLAQVEEAKATFIGADIWTLLDVAFTRIDLGLLHLIDHAGGFGPLLCIEGSDDEGRALSLLTLMISNHVVEINRMSERAMAKHKASPAATPQRSRQQVLHFTASGLSTGDIEYIADVARNVRCWAKYTHRNIMSFESIDIKYHDKVPQEVLVFVSSPISIQHCSSLHGYLMRDNAPDLPARLRIALSVSDGLRYLHGASPPQPHGGVNSHQIIISENNQPLLYPSRWDMDLQSKPDLDAEDTVDRITCEWQSRFSPSGWYHWNPVERRDWQRSLELRLQVDVWDFGSILYEMIKGDSPLTTYNHLVKGHDTLGYDKGEDKVPYEYWEEGDYKSRYATAASLLLDNLEASEGFKELLKSCWAIAPQVRPPMSEVFERLKAIIERMET